MQAAAREKRRSDLRGQVRLPRLLQQQEFQVRVGTANLAVAFSTDGRRLATAGTDSTVRIWDQVTGIEVARATHEAAVAAVKFSADGRYIATASKRTVALGDGLGLWDVATGRQLGRFLLSEGTSGVAFSPDGRYLATGAGDQSVRTWEIPLFSEIARFEMGGGVSSIVFSANAELIAAASSDRTARVWRWKVDAVREACGRLSRNLTRAESRTSLGDVPYRPTCPDLAGEEQMELPEDVREAAKPASR